MPRLIIFLIIAVVLYLFWINLKRQSPEARKKSLVRGGFCVLLGLVVFAVVTGRAHWLAAALAAALPLIKMAFSLALRNLSFLREWLKHRQPTPTDSSAPATAMSHEEAWQILGLKPDANRTEILAAHKQLIQKLHPDRGGNDYLAAQLNAARDLLLKICKD